MLIIPATLTICFCLLLWARAADAAPTSSMERVICQVFRGNCAYALRIARCESNLRPWAVGGAGEIGLFQLHPVHFHRWPRARLFNPLYNARAAYALSNGGRDWSAWTCRRYV